jgi:hypothetical protein
MKQTASPFQVASGTIPIRISVVISHLNQPALLDRCLRSLHQGVRRPDEIIVVDNGSAASPEALCGAYPGVRLFSEPALVPGPARNKGVAKNSGDVLAFIDADCLADPVWGQRATRTGYRIRYVAGMKVYHPARQTFSKMWKKWDRHSAHYYVAAWQHPGGPQQDFGLCGSGPRSAVLQGCHGASAHGQRRHGSSGAWNWMRSRPLR